MLSISIPSMLDEVARQEPLVGLFLIAAGLLFVLMGLRLSRMLIGLSFGVMGFVVGASISAPQVGRIGLGIVVALALGLASLHVVRPAAGVLAGIWAALVGVLLAGEIGGDLQIQLAIVAIMFVGAASLAFISFRETVAVVTSIEGTLLLLGGLIVMVNQMPMLWSNLRSLLVSNYVFLPFLVLSGTVAGFCTQVAEMQKKDMGQSA